MRLVHYKRIANAGSRPDLDALQVELIHSLRALAAASEDAVRDHVARSCSRSGSASRRSKPAPKAAACASPSARASTPKLIALIESDKQRYRLDGPCSSCALGASRPPSNASAPSRSCSRRLAPRDVESAAAWRSCGSWIVTGHDADRAGTARARLYSPACCSARRFSLFAALGLAGIWPARTRSRARQRTAATCAVRSSKSRCRPPRTATSIGARNSLRSRSGGNPRPSYRCAL